MWNCRLLTTSRSFALAIAELLVVALGPADSASPAVDQASAELREDAATALAAKVAALVEQLDAARLADREAAEKALVDLGPAALEVLPHGDRTLSAEVRQRLSRVRRQLELAFARSATKASLITLAEADRPLADVLAALAKQSGNPLVDGRTEQTPGAPPPPGPRIRVAFDKTPFWQALDQTLDAAGCSLLIRDASGDEPLRLVVVNRGQGERPRSERAVYRGALRFEVADVNIKHRAADERGLLRAVLSTAWEPRLAPISFSLAAADLSASDDKGRPLAVATPQARWETSSLGGQGAIRLSLPLATPEEDARSFSLSGRMTALLPGANVVFRFSNPAEAARGTGGGPIASQAVASQKIGDATVRLESFRRQDDRWVARFRVIYDNPHEAVQSHFDWLYKRRAVLAVGQTRREPMRFDAQAAEEGVAAVYEFPAHEGDRPGDIALEYTTPAVILSAPYEFEFRNTPLPR